MSVGAESVATAECKPLTLSLLRDGAGPHLLGELAAAEQVRPPTMTRLVQEMERAGSVRREADAADARVGRVRWTAKGERVLRRGREMRIAALDARLRTLPTAEVALLERAVGIIERVVHDDHATRHGSKGPAR